MNQEKIYKIVSISYFILSIYAIICLLFGTDTEKNPLTIHYFFNRKVFNYFADNYSYVWFLLSMFILIVFMISIIRFIQLIKKLGKNRIENDTKVDDSKRLYYLKKMQNNCICIVVLTVCFSFLTAAYSKELSFMILILIILFLGVYFSGYFLERLYLTTTQEEIIKKNLIMNALVNFVIILISFLLLLVSLQVKIDYVLSSIPLLGNDNLHQQLPKSYYVCRFIGFPVYVFYCLKLFQHLSIQDADHINYTYNYTIVVIIISCILIIFQNAFILTGDYSIKFFPYFLKNHLGSIILLLALGIVIGLQDDKSRIHIKSLKKKRKESLAEENQQVIEEENFTGFKF